jgi:hypothetical protein
MNEITGAICFYTQHVQPLSGALRVLILLGSAQTQNERLRLRFHPSKTVEYRR